MKKKPKELEFISLIKRDGSGTEPISDYLLKDMLQNPLSNKEQFEINPLSLSNKTYIASGFNSFVVKLKESNSVKSQEVLDFIHFLENEVSDRDLDFYSFSELYEQHIGLKKTSQKID